MCIPFASWENEGGDAVDNGFPGVGFCWLGLKQWTEVMVVYFSRKEEDGRMRQEGWELG